MANSVTSVVELEPVHLTPLPAHLDQKQGPDTRAPAPEQDVSSLPPPSTAADPVQRWNNPRSNIARVAACFWTFIVMGSNDAAYGVSDLPYTRLTL